MRAFAALFLVLLLFATGCAVGVEEPLMTQATSVMITASTTSAASLPTDHDGTGRYHVG